MIAYRKVHFSILSLKTRVSRHIWLQESSHEEKVSWLYHWKDTAKVTTTLLPHPTLPPSFQVWVPPPFAWGCFYQQSEARNEVCPGFVS